MFDKSFVHKTILQRLEITGCKDIEDYYQVVEKNNEEAELFIGLLQISYTEFFRNHLTFSVLERIILPEIIARKKDSRSKEIRIWSAACAAGQEAYSLAMLLENIKGQNKNISYRIFGTDQDMNQISMARLGQYCKESVGNIKLKHLEQWFTKTENLYAVAPELKKHCEFSVFNLLSEQSSPPESIYGDFDLVLCANILFYYKPVAQKIIIDKISDSLSEDGLLVCGEVEREILLNLHFKEIFPQSGIFRKRMNHKVHKEKTQGSLRK
jgi:chemotaxis methyl-accepting protein methylase